MPCELLYRLLLFLCAEIYAKIWTKYISATPQSIWSILTKLLDLPADHSSACLADIGFMMARLVL
jgi:hypothetical protein